MPPRIARLCTCLTLSAAMLVTPSLISAQRRPTYWGQIALGAAGAADSGFYASAVAAAVQVRQLLFIGRVASIGTENKKRMEEAGLLAGVATRPAVFHAGIAAGLGVAKSPQDSSVIAVPIEAQLSWRPL